MRYLRNADITKLYGISDKAVRNWITAAQEGRNKLELCEERGKVFIADTLTNELLITELVEYGKKFRNKRGHVKLLPSARFYEIYDTSQVWTIVNSLDLYHEFPSQFRNVGEGANYWSAYLNKLYAAGRENLLAYTIELLSLEEDYLKLLLAPYKHINVIDIGVGNGLAVKKLLGNLLASGRLNYYVGIDSSPDLLDITESNIKSWFNKKIKVKKIVRDVNYERFGPLLPPTDGDSVNLFLLLGGTLANFRRPSQALDTIRDSMSRDDLLVTTKKLDTFKARRFFDFNIPSDHTLLSARHKLMLDLLSIDEQLYDVEQLFDNATRSRLVQVKLKVDVSLTFSIKDRDRVVNFHRGDRLLLLRAIEFTAHRAFALYEESDFSLLRTTLSPNQEYLLVIARPKQVMFTP